MNSTPCPPTRLPGFTALVEPDGSDGSQIVAHPQRTLLIPRAERCRHWMGVGKTGGGKTTRLVLPMIYADIAEPQTSLVVIDAQLALTAPVSQFTRATRGARAALLYFNPKDPSRSVCWNPFAGLHERSEAFDLADTLAGAMSRGDDDSPFFRQQGTLILSFLIRALNRITRGKATPLLVREALDGGAGTLGDIGRRAGLDELAAFATELQSGNHNTQTVVSEMRNMVLPWQDDRVCSVTSRHELDFDQLERRPTVLIVGIPEQDVTKLSPLTSALLHRLFEWVMRRGQQRGGTLRRPVSLFIDEFGSAVGKIPDFQVRANTLRKRGLAITAAIQTKEQLDAVYGADARSLEAAFNHWVFIPPLAEADAHFAARQSGTTTIQEIVTGGAGETLSVTPVTRSVLLPEEIGRPAAHPKLGPRVTFLLADTPPFQGYLQPVWQHPAWAPYVQPAALRRMPRRRGLPRSAATLRDLLQPAHALGAGITALTNTDGWTEIQMRRHLAQLKKTPLDWDNTAGSARQWWEAFEQENEHRLSLVVRLAEELALRKATITEFFLAYVYSNTDNFEAVLHYLDYTRLKKAHEAARRARPPESSDSFLDVLTQYLDS